MRLRRILAFILAVALVVTALPGDMISRAAEGSGSVNTSIKMNANDARIHRSSVNEPDTDGVKAYTESNGLAGNIANMTWDCTNRQAKVCIYNLRTLMTETIGSSSDKGIGRYPYVITKIKVKEAGYYNIGTEINMRADGRVNTMVIVVDGVMHVVEATLGSASKQTVWKENLYLSEGPHSILYMSAIPQNESDCPSADHIYYYPWTNFWSFTFVNASGKDINDSLEILDASTLTGTDVENIFKESARIEAENTKYVTWNIYNTTADNPSASGDKTVGGVPSYGTSQQTFDDLANNGLDKTKTPYLQYMVEAPATGEYYLTVGATVGTSKNSSDPVPFIAVLVNDNEPVKAQFDGVWGGFDSVTVPVQLQKGINIIRCTSATKGQYAEGSSAWVDFDYFEVQKGLTVKPVMVSAADSDYNSYLKLNLYDYNSTEKLFAINSSGRGNLKWDYPSLYEEMLGIYSPITISEDRTNYWPYIAFTVCAEQAGEYQISAGIGKSGDAKFLGMIVDGAMHVIDITSISTELTKSVYLTKGKHLVIFTSPMPKDSQNSTAYNEYSIDSSSPNHKTYAWHNYLNFEVSEGLCFDSVPTDADIQTAMKNYSRIESEDISYASNNGNYSEAVEVTHTTRYNTGNTAIIGAQGLSIDGSVSETEKQVNTTQTYEDIKAGNLNKELTSYIQHVVIAEQAGKYVIRIGAYIEGSGTMPYGTILVNGNAYKAEFTGGWNGYEAVNLAVDLNKGENIIQCIGVTADQTESNGWIGYDFIDVPSGIVTEHMEVSVSDEDWSNYLYLNEYKDNDTHFGGPNYDHMRYDYPSLYEDMLGIYSDVKPDRAGKWPYIAFTVYAKQSGEYQIFAQIETRAEADTLGMIVDGAMCVVDVTTTKGYLTESVYLSEGKHVIVFTCPMFRDMVNRPTTTGSNLQYPYMNFYSFKLSAGLNFGEKTTDADIQTAMTNYSRIEVEDFSYTSTNGSYSADISKEYKTRYNNPLIVKIKGAKGAAIDGSVSDSEKSVNSTQTYTEITSGLDKAKTPYVQHIVIAPEDGTYTIRVGAYVEGSGTMPYGTILVNGNAYKAQFSGNWNGYDAVNLVVDLKEGKNTIQCIGITAEQASKDTAWIGYDFIDVPSGIVTERQEINASDTDYADYFYLNKYTSNGTLFTGGSNYSDMRYDFPSLYEEMLGIYSDVKPDRAGYWPYIAFTVHAEQAGKYQISAKIGTNTNAKTIGMIVDGAMHVVDVTTTNGYLTESVYLTEGKHVIIFTSPILRDMESRPSTTGTNVQYPYMDFKSFKLSAGLNFGATPTADDIKTAMTEYTRIEAEDIIYATANGNYNAAISKNYKRRYGTSTVTDAVKVKGFEGAKIDGSVSDSEVKVNTTQTYADIAAGKLDKEITSYIQYVVKAETAGTYVLRIGAYVEGSGTMPYGTILVNGKAYKAEFSGNWNGYDAVNLAVELQAGENIIQCIGITADQTATNGWIGYDFIDVSRELRYYEAGEYTETSVEKGLTFERRTTYETDGTISEAPYTISTWVYLPSGYMPVGGVIFGNYLDGETPCANFEIDANGVPTFYHINGEGKKVSLRFDMVSVCADEWTNLTFTISGNNVSCYRNGAFIAALTSKDADIDMEAVKNQYLLGGDLRPTTEEGSPNARYFKGRIIDVALYNKALSKEEVLKVYKGEATATTPYTRYELENAEKDKDVPDIMGNNDLDAKLPYFTEKEPVTDYAYSFAVVGDTQIVVENDVTKGEDNLSKIYDWILANKVSKNIQYVFGLGDITDNNNEAEWKHAVSQISRLDGEIPYSLVRGNHDVIGYGSPEDKTADYMTKYLGTEGYRNQMEEEGGFYKENNIANSWRTFTVGEVKYLMLALDYGATDEVLEWAGKIIKNHPEHNVIITTHAYLYRDGTTLDAGDTSPVPTGKGYNNGDDIWEKLVSKHENIVLVMCGHDPSDNIVVSRDKGDNGNIVTSMLIDPQGVDSDMGSTGMLAMLYFSEDGRTVQVEYFSTVKNAYFKEVNQFTLDLFNEQVSATDKDWNQYLKLNMYLDNGTLFGVGNGSDGHTNYGHIRYDYPSLYEDMLGIYSDVKSDRANWWPYIAFTVNAEKAGEYQISANIGTNKNAETIGMIVDGAMHVIDVTTKKGDLTESVYLTKGEHVIIFTSPMPRDVISAPTTTGTNKEYPYMDYYTFKLSKGLSFGEKPTDKDIQKAMTSYTRLEAEDVVYASYNANYGTNVIKKYSARYNNALTTIMGANGAAIDGKVTAEEKKANTSQTYAQLSQRLDAKTTSYVQYSVNAKQDSVYTIRVGAYVEGNGTMPYGTILVNGTAYKVQFTGNWNGYDAVNLPVKLQKGTNTIQCIGVTADQTGSNAWIGYDYLDIQSGLSANGTGATAINAGDQNYVTFNKYTDKGDILSGGAYDDMRWDRLSLEMLNYAYLGRIPYAALQVKAEADGTYDVYFIAEYNVAATSTQMGVLVDGVTTYTMTVSEFRSHVAIPLTAGTHTLVFTTPMPADIETAAKTEKFDKKAYPWMDMKTIILGKGLTVKKAPDKNQLEKPFESVQVEEYAIPNLTRITEKGAGSAQYLKAQTAAEIVKNGIDETITPFVEYHIDASAAGEYTIYVALNSGMAEAMTAEKQLCNIVIENGDARQVKKFYTHKDTSGVVRVIPVTLTLQKGINKVRITHFTGDSIQGKGYVWNDFDYIEMSPETAKKITFLSTSVLEAEEASFVSYSDKMEESMSGGGYLGNADYGYIDTNQITFEALDVENLDDVPRVTYTFEAEKAGTYTLSVKFRTGLINYTPEELEKIGFAVIVNGKDKQLVEYEMATLTASTTRTITVDLVEGENEITFTSTLADYMNAVSPRIESEYRLVYVDHDAVHLSYGLSTGKEAEKFSVEDSSVERSQLELLGLADDTDDVSGLTVEQLTGIIIGAAALAMLAILIIIVMKKKKQEEEDK